VALAMAGLLVSLSLPNMRVQRTRSSASPPHSPLTRGPLGGSRYRSSFASCNREVAD